MIWGGHIRNAFKLTYNGLLNLLRKSESKFLGFVAARIFLQIMSILQVKVIPLRIRRIISLAQPTDPLLGDFLPSIDVAIPCHEKDFKNLPLVIQGVENSVKNPILSIKIITPEYLAADLRAKFPQCTVLSDEQALTPDLIKLINDSVPEEKRGWILQQVIKLNVVIQSSSVATLILDADTILLRPKVYLDSNHSQILSLADEYHMPYKDHQRRVFAGINHQLSFVTHHQLMKRENVVEIFGNNGEGLLRWLKLADYSEGSALSEYDTYGEWMLRYKKTQVKFSKWNNVPAKINPSNVSYEEISHDYSLYNSISNHTYL
jgi:hypothetical protein